VCPARSHRTDHLEITYPPPPSQAAITARLLDAAGRDAPPESRTFADRVAPLTKSELIERCVVGVPGTAASVASDGVTSAVVVHSLAGVQFGTGWMIGDTGVAIGNRVGTALSAREDLPGAYPVPGGVLPHTLSAAHFRSADRSLLIATPGGDRQVQWLAQAGQRFRAEASLDEIVGGPRWFVCPEGDRFGVPGGIDEEWFMFAEEGIEWRDDERAAGFATRAVESVGGGLQGVLSSSDQLMFGSDPRSGGLALCGG
jgi:gamma-glutamyltranspeptidase